MYILVSLLCNCQLHMKCMVNPLDVALSFSVEVLMVIKYQIILLLNYSNVGCVYVV